MSVNRLINFFPFISYFKGIIEIILKQLTTIPFFMSLIFISMSHSVIFPQSCFANLSSELEQATGNRTKIVFAKCLAGEGNLDLTTPDYSIIGFDTYRNEFFEIVSGPRYCANPIISPDGNAVLFSDLEKNVVNIVSWYGNAPQTFSSGYGLCVQRDTVKKIDWVYVSDSAYGSSIRRYNLADSSQYETVWNQTRVSIRFTVSSDGRFGGGEFPWPVAGEVTLPNIELRQFGSGCNTAIAPDNSYRLFHMDGNHNSIWMYDSNGKSINQILFNPVPEFESYTTWIPRWSSDARFMTLTAPCLPDPKIHRSDIFFCCFNEPHDSITKWIRITNTPDTLENYAYAWIGSEHYLKFDRYKVDFIRKENGIIAEDPNITISSLSGTLHDCSISVSEDWLTVKSRIQDGKIVLENSIDTAKLMVPSLYSATVTVTCSGYGAESYRVNLKIENETIPVSLKIAPGNQFLQQFDTLDFDAICFDQFNTKLIGSYGWSVSGGGVIRDNGLFVSNGDTGKFVVRVWLESYPSLIDSTTITIYENPQILTPDSNTNICSGDTLYISWKSHVSKFKNLMVYLTTNSGRSWKLLNPESAIYPQYDSIGSFTWVIPSSICEVDQGTRSSEILNKCKIRITDYQDEIRTVSEKPFSIKCSCANNAIISPLPESPLNSAQEKELINFALFSLAGKLILSTNQNTDKPHFLKSLPKGMYLLKITSSHKISSRKILKW